MSGAIVVEAFWRVACWGADRVLRRTKPDRATPDRAKTGDRAVPEVPEGPVRA
jgi:hypothetical protein